MALNGLMTKLNRIFGSVLGCGIEFQPTHMLSSADWDSDGFSSLFEDGFNPEVPRYVIGARSDVFGFPVNLDGAFAGLMIVRGFNDASPHRLIHLAELLTNVLEYGIQQEGRTDRLRMVEERLVLMDLGSSSSSNVIPLASARAGRMLQVTDTEIELKAPLSPLTMMPLLIEVNESFPLQRIAIEVHEQSQRWAFLNVQDLPANVFESRESVKELGAMTIFIRDLTTLTTEQQLKLGEYLATQPGEDHPHIIAGVNAPVTELVEQGKIMSHLAPLFVVSALQSTGKTPAQVTTELINASLRHIVEQTKSEHAVGNHFIPFHLSYFSKDDNPSSVH